MNDPATRPASRSGLAFLEGGDATGALMLDQDWSGSPLGDPSCWPQSLRSIAGLLLHSRFPMFVAWGPELGLLYNDAYAEILGAKHPAALGRRFRDVWGEIWTDIAPLIDAALAGEATFRENLPLVLNRRGFAEQTSFTFSYSPVRDDAGRIAGMFCVCTETTEAVLAARQKAAAAERQRALLELDNRLRDVSDPVDVSFAAAEVLGVALGAARVGYGVLDPEARTITVERNWSAPGFASVAGVHHFSDYGSYIDDLRRGVSVANADIEADPATAARAAAFRAIGIRAFLDVPVVEQGRTVAQLFVHSAVPREWSDDEVSFVRDFAERTRAAIARRVAEADLRESESRFRNMADQAPVMMWVTDPSGACTYLNRRWYAFTGQAEGEGEGFGWLDAVHDDDRPAAEQAFVDANAAQQDYRVEFRVRRSDGVYRWAIDAAAARFGAGGEFLGYVGSVFDIDERREMEAALRSSTERAEALAAEQAAILGQLAEGVIVTDRDGRITFVNEAAERLHGVARLDVPPDDYSETYHLLTLDGEQYPSHELPLARAVLHGETVADARWRIRRRDGTEVLAIGSARPVRDAAGEAMGAVLTLRDDTERAEAERNLRENEARLRALTDNLPSGMVYQIATGRDGAERRFLYVSQSHEKLTGVPAEAVLADPSIPYNLILPEHRPALVAAEAEAIAGQKPFDVQVEFRRADGEVRWARIISAPRSYSDGSLIWDGIQIDITDQKRAEELLLRLNDELERRVAERTAELEQTQEALRQAQKMEAVGQLTGGIAHDFNNLLTGVIGSLDMMQRRIAKGETSRIEHYTTTAMTAANRAAALTHRLLAFSRRQPLDPKPVNANRLVTGMEELLRRTIGEAVALEIVTAGGLWQTLCDPNQLESAILNLAINARDAMPQGGKLTIETCNAYLDTVYAAKQRDVRPGQYVCICVSDTGEGMSKETIDKAFEPFFTTKPIGQGTGLGLSMIYGFTRQSEGYARIYSELGEGTTIKLYLPRYYGEAEAVEDQHGELTDAHRAEAGEVVLVVEDETAVRDLVVDVLEELGYRALEAADGPAGLKLLQSSARVDLLVTDIGLPGLNGRQLADAARVQRRDLKILFMTGYAENATIANGFLEPGMQMITKPFAIEALATRIRDMMNE